MSHKKRSDVLKVYIAPASDLTVSQLHKCLKIAVAQSGMSMQDFMFQRLTGDPGFRKAREAMHQERELADVK